MFMYYIRLEYVSPAQDPKQLFTWRRGREERRGRRGDEMGRREERKGEDERNGEER